MKNLRKISITTLGALAIFSTSVLAKTGTVNAPSGLVLRQEASKTGNPLTTVPDKTQVEIIEEDGEWYKITYNNQEGYLFVEYVNVEETEQNSETTTSVGEEKPTTANNNLKVYVIPSITSTVINEIQANTEITIEKQITNWSYISAGEVKGWVRTYGLQNTVQTSTEPNTENPATQDEPQENNPEEEKTDIPQTDTENPPTTTGEPSNAEQTEKSTEQTKGFVSVDYANVRKQPSTDSEIVTTLTKDTSFTIIAETEEWYKIKYISVDDVTYEGYIFKELVTK